MDECTKAILEFSQNPEPYFDYISYSGKGINELGYYDYCLRNSSNSYFLVNMNFPKAPSEVVTFIGLCFKQSCSSAQIEYFIPLAASIYNITLDGVQFSAKKSNGDEGDASINHSTYITIAIVLLILALGLIHPIVNLLKSMRENKKMPDGNANNIEEDVSVLTEDSKISMPLILKNNQQRPSRLMEFFKCFAADLNLKRLFSVREGPLDFFNGIRALSLLLVILGHDYYLRSGMSQNPEYILKFIRTPFYLVVGLAFYAVDVFFWLSGFFLAFVLLDPATKKYLRRPLTFAFAIFHRFCRIIPAYLVAMLIYWKIIALTGSGPLWPILVDRTNECEYMWRNVLFIENLFSLWDDMHVCFAWGWYLSNDFQLFIISLLLIFIYAKHALIGKISLWIIIVVTTALGIWVCSKNDYGLFPFQLTGFSVNNFLNEYYYKPWCRAPPYIFGLYMGILYKEFMNRNKECEGNKELKNYTLLARVKKAMLANWVVKYSFYISGFFICLFLTFFPRHFEKYPEEWSQGLIVFWLSFQRLIFVIGLTFILMHSLIISKDFIARFLAWTPFGVISNISFCAYLIHYFIIERSFMGSRQTIFYGLESVMYMLFADILLTLFFAALLSVFVEQSFINLEKFFKGEKKKPVEAAGKKEGFLSDKENQATEDKKRTVNTIN